MDFIERLSSAESAQTYIFYLGQAGFIIKSSKGQTLGIDLYLSDCVESIEGHDGFHRLMPQIVDPANLQLDVIIATHFHRDHFDIDAIPALMANGKTKLFCAYDCCNDVVNLGIDESRVVYAKPGDKTLVGNYFIRFINSDHGAGAPQEVGVLLTVDGRNILVVGDTSLHLDWKEEYLQAGPLDVMIAPINGAYGNLNEFECAALSEILMPNITIPCHFGMFASHGGNADCFIERMRIQKSAYKILTMGEGFAI